MSELRGKFGTPSRPTRPTRPDQPLHDGSPHPSNETSVTREPPGAVDGISERAADALAGLVLADADMRGDL